MKKFRIIPLFMAVILFFAGCGGRKEDINEPGPYDRENNGVYGTNAPTYAMPASTSAPGDGLTNNEYYDSQPLGNEEYLPIIEQAEKFVAKNPLLTFSLKVDTASYRNVVRYIESGHLPPSDAVRIEEMINYFNYDMRLPGNDTPFSVYAELGKSPFDPDKEIAFIRVKAKDVDRSDLPKSNLTFLIDSSGSMAGYDKLPLLKQAFGLLVDTLTEDDIVSIVTYSGSSAILLDSVSGNQKERIMDVINKLSASGSTAGGEGIETAYRLAEKNFIPDANNRVILATDCDFNVGVSSVAELERLMSSQRDKGLYLSILGVGTENLKDNKMETIAKNGRGNYNYIDNIETAQKVLVDELGVNLYAIADDVKAQIEFNPALVESYRLIGYENSMLADKDFNNDNVDAGIIGIGTDVVLMFEFTRVNDIPLKYQPNENTSIPGDYSNELFEVKIRYKDPGESESNLITVPVTIDKYTDFNSSDFNFALSVAGFGHLLKNSEFKGNITASRVLAYAKDSLGEDTGGYRKDFIIVVEKYIGLTNR